MTAKQPPTIKAGRTVAGLEQRLGVARAYRDAAMVARYDEGATMIELAEEVGLTRQQVFNIIRVYRPKVIP